MSALGGDRARVVRALQYLGHDQRRKHAQDHDDHHDLDQRETLVATIGVQPCGMTVHPAIIMRRTLPPLPHSPPLRARAVVHPPSPVCLMNLLRAARYTAVALLLLLVGTAALVAWILTRPLMLPQSPYEFEVRSGTSLAVDRAPVAGRAGAAASWPLIALARLQGVDRAIKAGSYEIDVGHHAARICSRG